MAAPGGHRRLHTVQLQGEKACCAAGHCGVLSPSLVPIRSAEARAQPTGFAIPVEEPEAGSVIMPRELRPEGRAASPWQPRDLNPHLWSPCPGLRQPASPCSSVQTPAVWCQVLHRPATPLGAPGLPPRGRGAPQSTQQWPIACSGRRRAEGKCWSYNRQMHLWAVAGPGQACQDLCCDITCSEAPVCSQDGL